MKKFRILLVMLLSLFSFSNAFAFSIESYDALLKNTKTQEKKYISSWWRDNLNAEITLEIFKNKPWDVIFWNWEIVCLEYTDREVTSEWDCSQLANSQYKKLDKFTFNDVNIYWKINIYINILKKILLMLFFWIPLNYLFLYPFLYLFYKKKRTNTQYFISSIIITFVVDIYFYYLWIHTIQLLWTFGWSFILVPVWWIKLIIWLYWHDLHIKNKRA